MHHRNLVVVLGFWVVALAFLGFSDSLLRILLVITGILLVIAGFKRQGIVKSQDELISSATEKEQKEIV